MRAAGYVRVSTGKQAEHGLSLEEQQRRVQEYIGGQKWELVAMYVERGASGRSNSSRPELDRLLASLPDLDAVVIPKLDRLGRSARHLHDVFARFAEHDVRLVSLEEQIDSGTPAGRMLRGILATMAEFESDLIGERVRAVSTAKMERGHWHGGPRPYGYEYGSTGGLVPLATERAVIAELYARFLRGDSMKAIAADLNARQIKGPRGGRWTGTRVRERLSSPVYAGYVHLNGELHEGQHEALVPRDQWEAVQALLQGAARGPGRRPTRHLFREGMLKCGVCGYSMTPRRGQGNRIDTYRCRGRAEGWAPDCDMPPVPRAALDTAVFDYFRQTALDPEASLKEYDAERQRLLTAARAARSAATASVVRISDRRARIREFMQDGQLRPAEWREQDSALAEAATNARRAAEQAKAEVAALEAADTPAIFEEWQAVREAVAGDVNDAGAIEAVRATLGRVFDHFVVGPLRNPDPELDVGSPRFADIEGRVWVLWPELRPGAAKVPLVPKAGAGPARKARIGFPIRPFGPILVRLPRPAAAPSPRASGRV